MNLSKESDKTHRQRGVSRRRLLAGLGTGTLAAVAGCLSGGDGGEGDGGEGDSGTTVNDLCSRFPGEFVAYDAGAVPTICDFDIPATLEGNPSSGDLPGSNGWTVESGSTSQAATIGIGVGINFEETNVSDEPGNSVGEPAVTDVEFGSETVTLYSLEEANVSNERHELYILNGYLPYTVGDTKLYFPVDISSSVEAGSDESVPEDCRPSVEEAAHHVGESLRVNEETTVEAHLQERWDDPP